MKVRLKVKEVAESKRPPLDRAKLSRLADLNYETVHGIWSNPERDVSLSTLLKIALALKVTVGDLYHVLPDDSP